ncbi:hypothetical protein [Treponema sp. R80B11-R83G3]
MRSKNIKTALAFILGITLCAGAFAQESKYPDQEIKISGYAKSGLLWTKSQDQGRDDITEGVALGSKDDAGNGQGRFRLDLDYAVKNMGIKTRVEWDNWIDTAPPWKYAFAYGNFLEDQLTFSVGKLGASPWGTGGPEMWKELETASGGGMRTEWKPSFIPGLNAGFVLNFYDKGRDQGWPNDKPMTLIEILRESVLGVSYDNDLFLFRFAYRLDGNVDKIQGSGAETSDKEDSLLYRVEERVIQKYLPGFQIWALGFLEALYDEDPSCQLFQNWLFLQYDPEYFTAQVRLGFDVGDKRSVLHIRPSFYWKFLNNQLSAGVMFWYGQDFGEGKMYEGSPFQFIEIEPKIQLNFGSSYVAFAYNFRRAYLHEYQASIDAGVEPIRQSQWINLRFCMQL